MKRWSVLLLIIPLAAAVFLPGIQWGLPSGDVNRTLFGDRSVWTGKQIIDLAGDWDANAAVGADVDRNPLQRQGGVIVLNDTDAQRAEIVRRYRLFSYQPDEMITLRALSQINPSAGRFDPKLYQYGGLWIYPIGGLLKAASLIGFVHLTPDIAYYLDHPEAFGRFYVVARLYSVLWGLVGVVAVFAIVRRLTAINWLAATTALTFAVLPVVVCMSHEAKPHLAGAVLMLLATLAAMRFLEFGTMRAALLVGALCGAATAMVPSAAPAFLLLPAMVMMRADERRQQIRLSLLAAVVGVLVYAITNPFVLINLLLHRDLLRSNAGNTGAMYAIGDLIAGVTNVGQLVFEGAGMTVAVAGFVAWLSLHFSPPELRRPLILLAIPAVAIAVMASLIAAGKPGEFGRFLILPDITLLIGLAVAVSRIKLLPLRVMTTVVTLFLTTTAGIPYLAGCLADANRMGTRSIVASKLQALQPATIILPAEPAPYCLPPVNLFDTRLLLAAPGQVLSPGNDECVVRPLDRVGPGEFNAGVIAHFITPISWADKPFEIAPPPVTEKGQPK